MHAFTPSYVWSFQVTGKRWRSHNSISQSWKPMLHANLMALCFTEADFSPIEVLHYKNTDFRPFCSCDLDLDLTTFIHELDPYSLDIYWMCEKELPLSSLLKVIILQPGMHAFSYTWSLLVKWQRWWSHHSIRHSRKLAIHNYTCKPHGSIFHRTRVMGDQSLHCRNRNFQLFCSCDLDLDPMTMTNLTHITLRYTKCANLNFLCQGFRKLSPDRYTYIHTHTTKIIYHVASWVVNKVFTA